MWSVSFSLGDTTRLRLLNLMGEQEVCVCYFVEILGGPQPKISRHLAYLRSARIVEARGKGSDALQDRHASTHRGRADSHADPRLAEGREADAG